MRKNNNKVNGFSLAEALITLLIISVVVAMTTVMVGKNRKFKKAGQDENTWTCSIVNGVHTVGGSGANGAALPGTGSSDGNSCTFIPPKGVSQFYVTAIGGGGGGASGSSSSNMAQAKEPNVPISFMPPISGPYYVAVIGGGGGGGGKKRGKAPTQGGGAGGVMAGIVNLKAGTTYRLNVGNGGSGGDKGHSGHSGQESSFVGGDLRLIGKGGGGGYGVFGIGSRKASAYNDDGSQSGQGGGFVGPSGHKGENAPWGDAVAIPPGYVCAARPVAGGSSNCVVPDLNVKLGLSLEDIMHVYGRGGMGTDNKQRGGDGLPGYVKALYSSIFSGEGGRAGMQSYYVYKRNPGETKVVIGKGGKGAQDDNEDGKEGSSSRFGERVIAAGGEGGRKEFKDASIADPNPKVEGGTGGFSPAPKDLAGYDFSDPLGGLAGTNGTVNGLGFNAPGSGGGGGGANAAAYGKGADGADGIVIVTW